MSKLDLNKLKIIELFNAKIKSVEIPINDKKHCGKEGHWLEKQLGIKHNSKNEPDIFGYEMKKNSNKITLGDFSASEYAFSKRNKRVNINALNGWNDDIILSRSDFIKTFGNPNPNPKKNNRFSWSGSSVPSYNIWNSNGQILKINDNNDIIIYYSFDNDKRLCKHDFPVYLQKNNLIIAIWKSEKMKNHIDNKFNKNGFFILKKIQNKYEKICFGKSFNFEYFIESLKTKKLYLIVVCMTEIVVIILILEELISGMI